MDSSDATVLLDDSPTGSLNGSPIPPQSPRGLFFQSPDPQETGEPATSQLLEETTVAAADGSDSEPESPSDAESLDDSGPTSSAGSSRADIASKRGLQATARNAVKIGTGVAHTFLAKSPGQREVGMYIADDEDAANIGNPIGSYLSRHGSVGGKLSPDAKDALDGIMGFGGFMAKQIARAQLAAQIDQHRAPAPVEEQA